MDELLYHVSDAVHWRTALVSLLLAYVLAQAIAAIYVWTYRGLSYSRSLVHALVVSGVLSCMLMLAIGNSLARGIGIVGTMALIRFRTNLRDPLDMTFVFASFGAGIAAGTGSHATALLGTLVFIGVVLLLRLSGFGVRRDFDGVLRLQLPADEALDAALSAVLHAECDRHVLVSMSDVAQGREQERVYQVTLREEHREGRLLQRAAAIPGAKGVSLAMQEATVEL